MQLHRIVIFVVNIGYLYLQHLKVPLLKPDLFYLALIYPQIMTFPLPNRPFGEHNS